MTSKILSFDWDGYLEIARQFLHELEEDASDPNENESKVRCGISRAYYAALNDSRIFLHEIDREPPKDGGSSHDRIIQEFKRLCNESNGQQCGRAYKIIFNELSSLKGERIKADYNDCLIDETMYSKNLENAKKHMLEKAIISSQKIIDNLLSVKVSKGIQTGTS